MAEARKLHATLVQGQLLVERQVAFLDLLYDRFELGDCRLEIFDGRVGHSVFDTLASISPRLKVTLTVSPVTTSEAARTI